MSETSFPSTREMESAYEMAIGAATELLKGEFTIQIDPERDRDCAVQATHELPAHGAVERIETTCDGVIRQIVTRETNEETHVLWSRELSVSDISS